MRWPIVALAGLFALPVPAAADEIAEALAAAREAYDAGDVQFAIDELDFARSKLMALKTDALSAHLPAAPEGWTREVETEMNAGLAMMGGGVGAEATYSGPDGANFTVTMMADNPMVASMSAMIANAGAMGMQLDRIGRQRFAVQDEQMMGMVGGRVLVQAEGAEPEVMRPVLEGIDFDALAAFGQ